MRLNLTKKVVMENAMFMIIPKDVPKIGIIIKFKKIDDFLDDTIKEATTVALKQIEDKKI